MGEGGDLWFHLLPLAAMIAMLCINLGVTQRRADSRIGHEAERLKAALSAEFLELAALYRENLDLLERDAGYLVSARNFVAVYRASLGRLVLLEPEEAAAAVGIFCHNERIEGLVAAHAKPHNGAAFKIEATAPARPEIQQRYLRGVAKIDAALALMSGGEPARAPVRHAAAEPAVS